ncbi:HAD family hydrolase [candidate division CSSED10-310 bacterium]|uniref:HAD family hydrolase n=1 Tax=candidate division CSSED10-310 bacterium TaxID=2855610 RepID=A0ABV6YWK3_UNCC1
MKKPAAVLFDFGDTILETVYLDFATGFKTLYEMAENREHVSLFEINNQADELLQEILLKRSQTMLESNCHSFLKLVFESNGLRFKQSYPELISIFRSTIVSFAPTAGIKELLVTLEKYHIKTGVISNTLFPADFIIQDLQQHGLESNFNFAISSSDYGLRKPHPLLFRVAAQKCNLAADQIWFCGDSMRHDVVGALKAGMFPVWYNPNQEKGDSELEYCEITHWRELERIIINLYQKQ